jgi:hypothetical protein
MVTFTAGTYTNVLAVSAGSWCILYVTDDVSTLWTDHAAGYVAVMSSFR